MKRIDFALSLSAVLLSTAALSCAKQVSGTGGMSGTTNSSSSSSASGTGGMSSCAMDCTRVTPPQCYKSVCNDGSLPGTVGSCVNIPDEGADCDDGLFCTTGDKCDKNGKCIGGPPNTCGMQPTQCNKVGCDEASKSCKPSPDTMLDGTSCTSMNLCISGPICQNGQCTGMPVDCSFDPNAECNAVACDPADGTCKPTVDPSKNGAACSLTGDLCMVNKTCTSGKCQGGTPKDCSSLTHDCVVGQCMSSNGTCTTMPLAAGMMCASAADQCNQGICDSTGACKATPIMPAPACNDHNLCTPTDACSAGACTGTTVAGCALYYTESFETCPDGWTLLGDWKCGAPTNTAGPPKAEDGNNVVGTGLTTNYAANDAWAKTTATSPPISLRGTTNPELAFFLWVDTDSFADGGNLQVSTDNGLTWAVLTTSKPYPYTFGGNAAWGGHESPGGSGNGNLGWQFVTASLQPYVGKDVLLRFAFTSDQFSSGYPGIYVDNMAIAEPNAIPLQITSTSIPTAYVGNAYVADVAHSGGDSNATWSIIGGTNDAWLSINPMTGVLSGTPTSANLGPGSVQVQVKESTLASNSATKTFNFTVSNAIYYQNFEGSCPNGWTLTGDWNCGKPVPIMPTLNGTAPSSAYSGSQCLATSFGTGYPSPTTTLPYASDTATSPVIDLTGATAPALDFEAYIECDTFSTGFNVSVSSDNGATYTLLPPASVMPAYSGSAAGTPPQSAWFDLPATGWQPYHADLTAYAGKKILVRFAFDVESFASTYAGVYVDDVVVH